MHKTKTSSNGFRMLVVLAAGFPLATACSQLPPAAVGQIQQADQAYRLAHYRESERLATDVIREHPSETDTAEAFYIRGLTRLKLRYRSAAASDLQTALSLCKRRSLEVALRTQLGHIAFDDAQYARAAGLYQPVIDDLPHDERPDNVLYRHALSLQRSAKFADARAAFVRLLRAHPRSPLADQARRKMAWKPNHFTIQCGAFSKPKAARRAADQLRRRGVDAIVAKTNPPRKAPYLVLVGRYADYRLAAKSLQNVRRAQPDAFIVP